MPSQSYSNPSIQSSPAKGEKPRTFDHTRQPGIVDQRKAEEEREDDMDDSVDTSVPLTTSDFQMKYIPLPCDFDVQYPEAKIKEILEAFVGKIASRKAEEAKTSQTTTAAGRKRPLEETVVQAWVRTDIVSLSYGYSLMTCRPT